MITHKNPTNGTSGSNPRPMIDVTELIDEQPVGWFGIRLVILSFFIMLTDGYDLLAASFGAPSLAAELHIGPAQLGPMFSASPFGMVIGAPLLGWVGDRFGRRRTVMLGTLIFGVFTTLCAGAQSIDQLTILRFVTGIGLGGMLPNITALNAEFAPRRVRATFVVLMFLGVTAGSAFPGLAIAALPGHGWRTLYLIGGVVPLLVILVSAVWLPESIKFLTLQDGARARARLLRTVRQLCPQRAIPDDAVFVTPEIRSRGVPVSDLFRGGLQYITPLLWILFITNLMTNYFLYSWMPTVFHSSGLSASQAALTTTAYYVGGLVGGLTVSRLIDRYGLVAVTVAFAAGGPAIACIGLPDLPPFMVTIFVALAGFCIFGVQMGINAASGLIYPTRIRATGAGWAFGIGRLGGIAGPMLGAILLGMHLPTMQLFMAPAIPMAIGTIACFTLMRLCHTRFQGNQLNDAAAAAS